MMNITKHAFLLTFFSLCSFSIKAQDPLRFQDEVDRLIEIDRSTSNDDEVVVFTGSSSIKYWDNLEEQFPEIQIIKTGFGGSHMSDLIYYYDKLIISYSPKKVFIYEGDNDLNDGENPRSICNEAKGLVKKIRSQLPSIQIFFISAKPSPARWHLKDNYLEYNDLMREFAIEKANVTFINVWDLMLDGNQLPRKDLFKIDDLHLNEKGYDIWAKEIGKYLE